MTSESNSGQWRTIQRIVLPEVDDSERGPLYVRGGSVISRTALSIAAGTRASYATYFGAFPAGYWHAHTGVRHLRLSFRLDGMADVEVRRTDAEGRVSTVHSISATDGDCLVEVGLGDDEGWLWCEVVAGDAGTVLHDVQWQTADSPTTSVTITVGITTYNREADCVRLLGRLSSDLAAMAYVERIVVADQGSRRLRDAVSFDAASALLRTRLQVIEQPNLGGSGGFSRGMAAAAASGTTHVLLLDDDVDLESESLVRLAVFAEYVREPTIVGAHMLSLVEPTRLHSFGERVDRRTMWWTPVDPSLSSLDLAQSTIETTPALSHRIDVDFNGWWMCLVPVSTVLTSGASLPLFIKWDDAEFGLRASAAGVPTVTLPGAALWHMPWTAKDDGLDWQAYFQLRNRLVAALLHGGRGVLSASLPQDVNHLLCAQYGSVALRNLALRDVLSGPDHMVPVLRAGPARANVVLADYGQVVVDADAAPAVRAEGVPRAPAGVAAIVGRAAAVLAHQMRRPRADAIPVGMTRLQGKWWALGTVDAAVVDAASGAGVFVVTRDRSIARREIARAVAARWRLAWAWRRLAREYRAAAPGLASVESWRRLFTAAGSSA